jgi:aminopeptidase N
MLEQFYHTTQVRAMRSDASRLTHAIHANVSDPTEVESMFDAISCKYFASIIA